ncbi:F-box protein [Cardamine amara subsp. amara]|uniref:F-box protein n=1 Tax=Cardamine amara subsp. amara TaxID=228776 RepID=A0ABD1ACL3_CARAN
MLPGGKELIHFHRCQTWGLPKSLGSFLQNMEISDKCSYVDSSNGLVLMKGVYGASYVGNPVLQALQQRVEIPSPPCPCGTVLSGLVTCVDDHDGVVLSFKVVRTVAIIPNQDRSSTCLCFCVYSSDTGIWTCKRLHCPYYFTDIDPPMTQHRTLYLSPSGPMTLHGTLYLSPSGVVDLDVPRALIALDFYGESNLCWVVPLPDYNSNHNKDFKRALTTSMGFVMYIQTLPHNVLKVWRLLNNDDDTYV